MAAEFPFRTNRLVIRRVTVDDRPSLLAILADADVMKLALYERPLSDEEALQFISEDFAKDDRDIRHLGVLHRAADDAVIGFAGLLPCKYYPDDLEIGFVLDRRSQGQGYATEIGRALVDVALRTLHRPRVLALCDPRNLASLHVLEKLGMRRIDEILTEDRGPRAVFEARVGSPDL
ncbi:MAG TPA: GNAT family N-acetyltransferase [Thermoanaerobaculia bacterium]|nr:GNAT family N-acetyltransferase [Thermoanaerobaculia bacterium]